MVVTVSPQSRASLAARFGVDDAMEAGERLVGYLKRHLGVDFVFDEMFGRELSLLESAEEFVERYRKWTADNDDGVGMTTTMNADPTSEEASSHNRPLPMLASACPGWICYAEKTHGNFILPYISTVKSPQQILGWLYRDRFMRSLPKTYRVHGGCERNNVLLQLSRSSFPCM